MNVRAENGHNNPPADPIDEAIAPFADAISEAENWLDGKKVTTEAQMNAVDAVLKDIRKASPQVTVKPGTLAAVINGWKASVVFQRLRPSTQENRWRIAMKIQNDHGSVPFQQIAERHIRADLRNLSPAVSKHRRTVWASIYEYAEGQGLCESNIARSIPRKSIPKTEGQVRVAATLSVSASDTDVPDCVWKMTWNFSPGR